MTAMTLRATVNRIAHADPSSPIAVFASEKPGVLNVVFANTTLTQARMKLRDSGFIGVFSSSDMPEAVTIRLAKHIKEE